MVSLFCPVCGKDVEELYDGLCKDCFIDGVRLIEFPNVVHAVTCPTCDSVYRKGTWIEKDINELIFSLVEESIAIHPEAESITLSVDPLIQERIINVYFIVRAKVKSLDISEDGEIEIRIKKESCDRCSRISSGYHEGIIQIRADGRYPTQKETNICADMAYELIDRLKEGDRLAFISKVLTLKEGIDIYVGSMASAKQIARSISDRFGVSTSESSKLVGNKDGRKLYRVTFSVRLPKFTRGDIVRINERVALIKRYEKKVTGIDLMDGCDFSLSRSKVSNSEILAKIDDSINAVLCTVYESEIDILDPDTYKTITLKKPKFFKETECKEVPIVKVKGRIFLVP
ncbi:MAG: NMD3-related protein [Halobacteriota archaeon]|nr:NMD3-related protein [Halobacteriota archaeon]